MPSCCVIGRTAHGRLLGCGALGGWVGEVAARAGAAAVHLVDNGMVKPGLLARQNFRLRDIGRNKSAALAERLRSIAAGVECEAFERDAPAFLAERPERVRGYDVVIDCTASSIVQMKLERDWGLFERTTPPMLSMGIDAQARRCLAVAVPANSAGGVWDAYLQLKRRLCLSGADPELVQAFYSDRANQWLTQPEPGCSDPTFVGSAADVAGLAAAALNAMVPRCAGADVPSGVALSALGSGTSGAAGDVVSLSNLAEVRAGGYRVRIARSVHTEARAWARQNARLRSPEHETGGLLWGLWDDALRVISLFDASGPPADSVHEPGRFVCGVSGTADEHARRLALTRGACGFLGMWHTHPRMEPSQSLTDVGGMAGLVAGLGRNQRRALMLIYGQTEAGPAAGVYAYESQATSASGELVSVGGGLFPLEEAVA